MTTATVPDLDFGLTKLPVLRTLHQLQIGPRVCQKVREPRSDGEVIIGTFRFGKKQEVT